MNSHEPPLNLDPESCQVSFPETRFAPVCLPKGAALSENLTAQNSPILFGCRIGICGTCAIEVSAADATCLHPRTSDEEEFLQEMAPQQPQVRLACQIHLNANIRLRKVTL